MTITITSVSPDTVFLDGGYEIIITGTFDVGHTYRVYIGPTGTTADPQCYSGIPGQGNIIPYWKPTELRCYTPEMDYSGSAYDILVVDLDAVGGTLWNTRVAITTDPTILNWGYLAQEIVADQLNGYHAVNTTTSEEGTVLDSDWNGYTNTITCSALDFPSGFTDLDSVDIYSAWGQPVEDDLASAITTAKKNFHSGVYSLRKVQPPRLRTGPRNIDNEEAV